MNAAEFALTDVAKREGLDPESFIKSVKDASAKFAESNTDTTPEELEEESNPFTRKDSLPVHPTKSFIETVNTLRRNNSRREKALGKPNRDEVRYKNRYDKKNKLGAYSPRNQFPERPPLAYIERNLNAMVVSM